MKNKLYWVALFVSVMLIMLTPVLNLGYLPYIVGVSVFFIVLVFLHAHSIMYVTLIVIVTSTSVGGMIGDGGAAGTTRA